MIQFLDATQQYASGTYGIRNVNLTVKKGEFVFIVGPNGSGKTTLTKLVTREEKLQSGKLFVNGFAVHEIKERQIPYLRRTMGVVFQDLKLFEHMTVYENIAFAMRVVSAHPAAIKNRVNKLLDIVGLPEKAREFPSRLSGGEMQRVAFARAIVNNPRMIIADEPTGNVDRQMSFELMDLLDSMNKLGKTIIVITHDNELVNTYSKRVIRMEDGVVVEDRPAEAGGDAQ